MQWFTHDRFGMFIHWGLYAIPARGEWVRSTEEIPEEDYIPFFNEFNPKDFDPKKWARLAKQAGMKYAVLTAKHHDGFCLFDSALTDWKVTNTPYGKDIVREYLDAFRAEGIKVGLFIIRCSIGTTRITPPTATASILCATTSPIKISPITLITTLITCTVRCASSAQTTASSI